MEDRVIWWRRPQVLAAMFCAVLGVALLAGGPLLRAGAPAEPAGADLALADAELLALDGPPPAPSAVPTADLVIYVSGAVAAPDVYRLAAGARVKDAVLAAGGLLVTADPAAINLAAPLADAQHIHIPEFGTPAAATASGDAGGIDLNSASQAALEDLPGVGATLAARIVAYRESNGPFAAVEGLREVTGIGDKLFDQIAPLVTAGG